MIDLVWDMETNDPDDFLTLLFLAEHPQINLKAVTILPGSAEQVGLVKKALEWFDLDIPVGARNLDTEKQVISQWHYDAYGEIEPSRNAFPADEVLRDYCNNETTLLMGAPLTNLRTAIRTSKEADKPIQVGNLVIQGGFAGEGVVPSELQMEKFRGMATCPTHNLIVDRTATEHILRHDGFAIRRFVSKMCVTALSTMLKCTPSLNNTKARARRLISSGAVWRFISRSTLLGRCCTMSWQLVVQLIHL